MCKKLLNLSRISIIIPLIVLSLLPLACSPGGFGYSLTVIVNPASSGNVSANPFPSGLYPPGSSVQLTANSDTGWSFSGWSGSSDLASTTANPTTITMNTNETVVATFKQNEQNGYTLTINTIGQGTVTVSPQQTTYASGTVVQLTPTPVNGWSFSSCSGSADLSGTTVTMNSNETVTVTFTQNIPNQYTLTIQPTGQGTVTISPPQTTYASGVLVQLTATPATGWTFSGWSGSTDVSSTTANPTTITMNTNETVTATFKQNGYTLTFSVNPAGAGVRFVSVNPSNGDYYPSGTSVTLTAKPASGYVFDHWSGDASGTSTSVTIIMNSNKNVIANFVAVRYSLSISVSPPAGGSVSPNSNTYDAGTSVILTATPASGYRFDSWSGDISGTGPTNTVILDSNKSVVATFVRQFTLQTSVSPVGSGTIYFNPPGGIYDAGMGVSLTATATSGYTFDSWSGGASGTSATTTITMNSDQNVVANFKKLYQVINNTLPAVPIFTTYSVDYSKPLQAGDNVDGFVQLTGQFYSVDNTYVWNFQILGPGGESIQSWTGNWANNYYHPFTFTASYTGTYKLRISHGSTYPKNLTINIWPPGWN